MRQGRLVGIAIGVGALVLSAGTAGAQLRPPRPDGTQRRLVRMVRPAATTPATATTPAAREASGKPADSAAVRRLRAAIDAGPEALSAEPGSPDEVYMPLSASGHVRALVAPAGRGWTVASSDPRPEAQALAFLQEHRAAFGWAGVRATLRSERVRTAEGRSSVRFEQRLSGLRVFGAAVVVQVEPSGEISYVLSDIARDGARMYEPTFATKAKVAAAQALQTAIGAIPANRRAGDMAAAEPPELMVYEPSVIGGAGPSQLVWHVRVRSQTAPVNEVVLVDAESGQLAFHYSDIKEALNRRIYDAANVLGSAGTRARFEGDGVSSVADVNFAYDYFGDTYNFYWSRFGRDSYDGAGAMLVGRVRYCPTGEDCPYPNAYWNGAEMHFGNGYASADDVVSHELTHAVTERESNLIYWGESGAINESLSDIFGEFVDLTNGDTGVRWLMGEDLPIGAIRSMSNPPAYGDPDRRFSPNWFAAYYDNRGVHFNSGVANKLAYLLTDGGTFNGQVVAAQGLNAVAALFYQANANLLAPASDYYDLYAALRQAGFNLGWSTTAFLSLDAALRAVEIDLPSTITTVFSDGFEGGFPGAWEILDIGGEDYAGLGTQWGRTSYRRASGSYSAYGTAGGPSAVPAPGPYPPYVFTWMTYGPFSLAGASKAWVEFDSWMDTEYGYDGIFFGVSIDGNNFTGYEVMPEFTVTYPPVWVHELFDFREVAGAVNVIGESSVWFTIAFISDVSNQYEGVYVDNVVIQKGSGAADIRIANTNGVTGVTAGQPVSYTVAVANWGPGAVRSAHVVDTFPASLTGVTWTCTASAGAYCPVASGSGTIDRLVNLGAGGTVTFVATGQLGVAATGTLVNTATVALTEVGYTDPVLSNNSATDSDPITPVTASIGDAAVSEGNAGTTAATFTVTLSSALSQAISMQYATANGTAIAGTDYQSASGTLNFPAGSTSQPITVNVIGDTNVELDKGFVVNLSSVPVTVGRGQGVGTILDDDAAPLSDRELIHGASEWQSLAAVGGVARVGHYRLAQQPRSSYEVVVESASADVQPVALERLGADNATVLAPASQAVGSGAARSLRWHNSAPSTVTTHTIRVRSGGSCSTDCAADDVYRIRSYETTCSIPRFNNSGSQLTVVVLQNPTDYTITGTVYFWSSTGALLASSDFTLSAKQTYVLNTSSLTALYGRSGAVTIAHDGRYGDLSGKSVALEPATGFSFDSPMAWRPIR